MKRSIATLFVASSLVSCTQSAEKQPNIVLFLVDDMGWQDTSLPFHSEPTSWNNHFHTPNMERLAQKGVQFTNAYACPVSSPSRVSLMSGVNATRHKVTNWTRLKDKPTDRANELLDFEPWNYNGIIGGDTLAGAYTITSFPQILRDNGYMTLFIGKAHFGAYQTPAEDPLTVGFDRNIGGHSAGVQGSYLSEKNYGNGKMKAKGYTNAVPDLEEYYQSGTFLTEALTQESVKLMDEALSAEKPFFLYMAHYAVHAPYDADARFYQKYKDRGIEEAEARYASVVEGMDKSLGDIMDYLDERGIADNTIILFMSDNGGYTVGSRNKTFGGVCKNTPLRGGKGALYEGGVREPMIAYVPGVTAAATRNDSPVIIEDFFPTILELASAEGSTIQPLDSKSFVAALGGEKINGDRAFYWHYPNNWGERNKDCGMPGSAIRVGNMKYIYKYETQKGELYDLSTDIGESHNLIGTDARYDALAADLAKQLSDKLRAEGSSMPIIKATGERSPYPDQTL